MKFDNTGFSRADLLFSLFGVSLVFGLAASLFGSTKSESQRTVCFNNLRQIGRGFQAWGNDNGEQMPWQVYWNNGAGEGTLGHPLRHNAWFHYDWISAQLGSPTILVCPADEKKRPAQQWGNVPGGIATAQYRNNAVSYPPFLHAVADSPGSLLSGDRNFRVDQSNVACSYVNSSVCFGLQRQGSGSWTNGIHGSAGHLLFRDGTVRFTPSADFRQTLPSQDENGYVHGLPVY